MYDSPMLPEECRLWNDPTSTAQSMLLAVSTPLGASTLWCTGRTLHEECARSGLRLLLLHALEASFLPCAMSTQLPIPFL